MGEVVRQNILQQAEQRTHENPEGGWESSAPLHTLKLNGNEIERIGGHWLLRGLQVSASIQVRKLP